MRRHFIITVLSLLSIPAITFSQDHDNAPSIGVFSGMINYQGDLNPHSFTFKNSNVAFGLVLRKPLNNWLAIRAGFNVGRIDAADAKNRDYLKARNLSFSNAVEELYAALEITPLNISKTRFTPFAYIGFGMFHADPWTLDNTGVKTFLRPLSTEGQGLPQYPKQRSYGTLQPVLPFGGGARFAINDATIISIGFHQRKTFFDYMDDVSSHFVDYDVLLAAKGPKAVELAYRGDELPGGVQTYPVHGEQRGTPSEMDWYYYLGLTLEVKLNSLSGIFQGLRGNNNSYYKRCPRVPVY